MKELFLKLIEAMKSLAPADKHSELDTLNTAALKFDFDAKVETSASADNKKSDAVKADESAPEWAKQLQKDNVALNAQIADMLKRDQEREDATKRNAESQLASKVKERVDKAIKDGVIPAKNEELAKNWVKMLNADFAGASIALDALTPSESKTTVTTSDGGTANVGKDGVSTRDQITKSAAAAFSATSKA